MKMDEYKSRIVDKRIELYLKTFGAILIEGPKWCGKTWTSRYHSNSEFSLADPTGNFNHRQIARLNPDLILDGDNPRLIDEWQEVPAIWDAVRGRVDAIPKKGQFIPTGSASVDKSEYIHSGTGRIAHLRMRHMSLYEAGESDGKVSLEDICFNRAKDCLTGEVKLSKIIEYILVGGWPSNGLCHRTQ